MSGFYLFCQNNSGGFTIIDDKSGIGDYVFIWALSWDDANQRARQIGLFDLPYCDCCGARFQSIWNFDEPMEEGMDDVIFSLFSLNKEIVIFFHSTEGAVEKVTIPNNPGEIISYVWEGDRIRCLV